MAFLIRNNRLYTLSFAPGISVYDERLVKINGNEYREWSPYRSKLAAAIKNGLKEVPIKAGSKVLYLGAAQGTTPSHVSDIVGKDGYVVCIEFSQKAFEKLLPVCEQRENMLPVLADANFPERYEEYCDEIDVIYQDVAQPNQADILLKNTRFLKKGGSAVLCIKSRSVDVTKQPKDIFESEISLLKKEFEVIETIKLDPWEKDHVLVTLTKR